MKIEWRQIHPRGWEWAGGWKKHGERDEHLLVRKTLQAQSENLLREARGARGGQGTEAQPRSPLP